MPGETGSFLALADAEVLGISQITQELNSKHSIDVNKAKLKLGFLYQATKLKVKHMT